MADWPTGNGAYLEAKQPGEPVWGGTWSANAAGMLGFDLADAGIEAVTRDTDGLLVLDFHAVGRHPVLTHIARTAPLHVAQKLAGHSPPGVTAR